MIINTGENREKLELSYTAGEKIIWCSWFAKSLAAPQNVKHRITIWPSNYILKRPKNRYSNLYTNIQINIIHKSEQVETQMFTNRWINKMWYICTMKYYSAKTRDEVLIHAPTWINLENTTLSERRQDIARVHLYGMSIIHKSVRTFCRK